MAQKRVAAEMRPARSEDLPAVLELLKSAALPSAGVSEHFKDFILEIEHQTLLGCAGLEVHGEAGLLRSLAVNPNQRSSGIGSRLVNAILERARTDGLSSVSLLTTTAQDYFSRFGFRQLTRADLPASLNASAELRGACPETAVVMMLEL